MPEGFENLNRSWRTKLLSQEFIVSRELRPSSILTDEGIREFQNNPDAFLDRLQKTLPFGHRGSCVGISEHEGSYSIYLWKE